jgi:plastocyanin
MTHRLLRLPAISLNLALLALMGSAAQAANYTVTATGDGYYYTPYFSPARLQVQVGDTVTFQNPGSAAGGGMHNVHADDNSFQCSQSCSGPNNTPSSMAWSFQRTFTQAGTVAYHCDMHGGAGGVGMSGTITVVAAGAAGTLAFSSSSYSVDAGAGSVTISVPRSGSSSGAVSVQYATSDGSAKAGTDYMPASGTLNWADGDAAAKSFSVTILNNSKATSDLAVNLSLSSPAGGAALGIPSAAVLTIHEHLATFCTSDAQTLCLGAGGRFQVRVEFVSSGQSANATAVPLAASPESGLFYFFGPSNIEMLIKVLDACTPFNHYWVFFAATTNVQFTISVTDTHTGDLKTYLNPPNQAAAPVQDTSAFATCP